MKATNLVNKKFWLIEDKPLVWNTIKDFIFSIDSDIQFFSSIDELTTGQSFDKDNHPDFLICKYNTFIADWLEEATVDLKNSNVIIYYDDVVPSLQDAQSLFNLGVKDIISWPISNLDIFIAKLESFEVKRNKENQVNFSSGVNVDGKWIKNLTSKQIQFIGLFLESKERTISREAILNEIWEGIKVHPKVVDVHLYNLRRKVAPFGFLIKSKGRGRWSLISREKEKFKEGAAS